MKTQSSKTCTWFIIIDLREKKVKVL